MNDQKLKDAADHVALVEPFPLDKPGVHRVGWIGYETIGYVEIDPPFRRKWIAITGLDLSIQPGHTWQRWDVVFPPPSPWYGVTNEDPESIT